MTDKPHRSHLAPNAAIKSEEGCSILVRDFSSSFPVGMLGISLLDRLYDDRYLV